MHVYVQRSGYKKSVKNGRCLGGFPYREVLAGQLQFFLARPKNAQTLAGTNRGRPRRTCGCKGSGHHPNPTPSTSAKFSSLGAGGCSCLVRVQRKGTMAMAMYAIAMVPLQRAFTTRGSSHVWFADDTTAPAEVCGNLEPGPSAIRTVAW